MIPDGDQKHPLPPEGFCDEPGRLPDLPFEEMSARREEEKLGGFLFAVPWFAALSTAAS